MENCPHCGKRLRTLRYNRWKVIEREHSRGQMYQFKKFRVYCLVNVKEEIFGYITEELEVEQEYFCMYEGNENFACSVGTVSTTLKEAKGKLRERAAQYFKEFTECQR